MNVSTISDVRQYLTFNLSDEAFAMDVAKVREILEWVSITKVPQTPDYMSGVINLRGMVVPVVDMRLKFDMPALARTVNSCIIVVEVTHGEETVVLGFLVDSVQEVIELEPAQIEAAPRIGTRLNADFIQGMGNRDGRFIMILDIDKLFSVDDIGMAGTGLAA